MKKILFLLVATGLLPVGCKTGTDVDPPNDFDRAQMLSQYADSLIIPNYNSLYTDASDLETKVLAFQSAVSIMNLENARQAFIDLYMQWQHCSSFEFGPAENTVLRANLNTFPTDTAQIKSNIFAGNYNLSALSNIDAKGFPALDYLLFGVANSPSEIVAYYTAVSGTEKIQYVLDVVADIKTRIKNVVDAWNLSYKHEFVNATGTSAGSSVSLLVNQMVYDFELVKNYEIGIPLGKKTLGSILPEKSQGYYSGYSARLATEHLKSIRNIFTNSSISGFNGAGLDDNVTAHNSGLTTSINQQFAATVAALDAIPDPMSQTLVSDKNIVEKSYTEILKLLVLLKNDMTSTLSILITYQDNDGD